uniref:Sulfhydryl oxidase n=1 Tax=Loa loa TaxID=7209 RepID=A0A1I7W2S8_LOALO
FYLDWCGHCRSFAETYKLLARDVYGWNKVVRLAAINCADPFNEVTCQTNAVQFFPYIKYFPRNSSSAKSGIPMGTPQSVGELRNLITQMILLEYNTNRSSDWPNFDFLRNIEKYSELWRDVNGNVPLLVIIFEEGNESLIGAELLLDMTKYNDRLVARRSLRNHSLADALYIKISRQWYRQKYFASERDILKAARYAVFDEVTRNGEHLAGNNLTALRDFLDVLAKDLPTKTIYNTTNKTKEESNFPFPVGINWEHCAGSSPKFRGYTCDSKFVPITPLVAIRNWVNHFFGCQHCREHFLRMTTQLFALKAKNDKDIKVCEYHFLFRTGNLTVVALLVRKPEDVFMYLWQAHNIVNARLRGQNTEDPEFPKRQFPPDFLCDTCRYEGYFDNDQVKDFLLIYYSAIRPISG